MGFSVTALKIQYDFDSENERAKQSGYYKMTEVMGARMVVRGGAHFFGSDTLDAYPTAVYVTIGENGYRLFKDNYDAFLDAVYDAAFQSDYGISNILITEMSD